MFTSARIKLTTWYLLIIMLISIMFSFSLYRTLTGELERGFHRISQRYTQEYGPIPPPSPDALEPAYLQASEDRIKWTLIYINLIIFGVSGAGGYLLAGITLKPIREMIDEQNRFITDASHELRTPLTSLRSEIEVYLRGKNKTVTDATALAKSNLEEVQNLQILSDRLISLTQYPHVQQSTTKMPISLSDVLDEAIHKIQKHAIQKDIQIKKAIHPLTVVGEYESLVQLFGILLDNAVKYSPKKSTITVDAHKSDGSVIVRIIDTGIGIAEKDIPHIFDRFYRADNSRSKQEVSGYGLGLSIAKKIVVHHRGTIKITSKIDKGTTCIVHLPTT